MTNGFDSKNYVPVQEISQENLIPCASREPEISEMESRPTDASSPLQMFQNDAFRVRVVMRDGSPWFVAKDVAACIEYSNVTKMCELCRDKDKIVIGMDEIATNDLLVSNMTRELTCISESGLYRILAKCSLPKCEPFESWVFDEVLPSIRKTGSYTASKPETNPMMCLPQDYEKALEALLESVREKKRIEAERDEAIRTKALIGSRREATAMATASVKTRECKKLQTENDDLQDQVGRGQNWRTVSMMKQEWLRDFDHAPNWRKLKQFSEDVGIAPIKDVEEKIMLPNGTTKTTIVFRYHREAWARYRKSEEVFRTTRTEQNEVF